MSLRLWAQREADEIVDMSSSDIAVVRSASL